MIKVGLTGNIGSGKSLVSKIFISLGIPVFNADIEASQLFENPEVIKKVVDIFGDEVIHDQKIDKKSLAAIVFSNRDKLLELNSIIHPLTFDLFDEWILNQDAPYSIMESAILAEYDLEHHFDLIIAVSAPFDLRLERILVRDRVSKEHVIARMRNQLEEDEIIARTDHHILNDEETMLIPQVIKIHNNILLNY